ncbi:unnamed protein product [Lymnaea stagnalis]|uniref:Chitin-binding type-2 domain-containing protein n=1 Tax=Lymnaea stagnalis TaxID=6523 RepID=A0AAV2IRT4_LYMST
MDQTVKLLMAVMCVSFSAVVSQDEVCQTKPQGWVVEVGCWGHKFCNASKQVQTEFCDSGKVLDRDTMTCVLPGSGHNVCGNTTICSGRKDGFYPDTTVNCISYFVCSGGNNLGRLYCAAHLVFNSLIDSCDWSSNVAPPCGTLVASSTTPAT